MLLDSVRRTCSALWPVNRLAKARRPAGTAAVDGIRQAMLQALDSLDQPDRAQAPAELRIGRRILLCRDVEALWHLRCELMHVLSAHHGEREARCQLDSISGLFDGLLPSGLHSNRAPLRLR